MNVWVNNAGVSFFSLLSDGTFEDHRRVIETNVFGSMLGARAAIPLFREQGYGVLINVGSVLSEVGQPFVPSYTMSKFAIRGMTEALRVELADEPDIHACTVFPFSIDTPHFQSGASGMPTQSRAIPPIQEPEKVAEAIVSLARNPRRELHVPRFMPLGLFFRALFPSFTERLLLHALRAWHFDNTPQIPTKGNLYTPVETREGSMHGRRRPQLTTLGFAAWALAETIRIGAGGALTTMRPSRKKVMPVRHVERISAV